MEVQVAKWQLGLYSPPLGSVREPVDENMST